MASTRERIIEATLTLIAGRGLSQVTMIQIARTADIARQTLYNHYPDIPAILTEALSHHDTEAIDHLDQALSVVDTPTDTIRQLVRHIAAMSTHAGHSLESHLALPTDLQEHLNGFSDALEQRIRVALADGVDRGEFRPDLNIRIDSVLVRHTLDGISTMVAAAPHDAPRIVADATRTLLASHRSESP